MKKLITGLIVACFLVFSGSAAALDANIQPSNPDDITLNSSNNHKIYKEFDGTSSTGSVSTYTWDLVGESSSDTGPKANFSFSRDSSGSNTIRLTVSNKTSSDVAEVTQIIHDVPEATISANTTSIEKGQKVSFSSSVTNSFDAPLSYDWKVDGTSEGGDSSFTKKFDSTGDFDVKLNVSDTAGNFDISNIVTISVSDTNSSSDDNNDDEETTSSGSSGGAPSLDLSNLPDSKSKYFIDMNPGTPATTTIDKSEKFGIKKIEISVKNSATGVSVKVYNQKGKPSNIEADPEGKAYRYMNISVEDLNDSNIEEAHLDFEVNNSWINENNISRSKINLSRYNNGEWQYLQTNMTSQGESKTSFTAETPGFSYFAVSGEEETTETESIQDNQSSNDENQTAQITKDSQPEKDQNNNTSSDKEESSKALLPSIVFKVFLVLLLTASLLGGGYYYYSEIYEKTSSERDKLAREMQEVKEKLEKVSEKNYDAEQLREELNKAEQEAESENYEEAEKIIQSINEKLDKRLI